MKNHVEAGDWVIIKYANDKTQLQRVNEGSSMRLGHFRCALKGLIGAEYGTCFEPIEDTDPNALELQEPPQKKHKLGFTYKAGRFVEVCDANVLSKKFVTGDVGDVRDNRLLQDEMRNQKLEAEEILRIRQADASGDSVVAALLENSQTFQLKTNESKEKYIRRKKSVHSARIRVLRSCTQTIGQVLWEKTNVKGTAIGGLRYYDTLPHILSHANIHTGARALVWDEFNGYLLGSIMERVGKSGQVVAAFIGPTFPEYTALEYFNFPDNIKQILLQCDLPQLFQGKTGNEAIESIKAAKKRREGFIADLQAGEEKEMKQQAFDVWYKKRKAAIQVYTKQITTFSELREQGADSMVLLSKGHIQKVFKALFPYLGLGRPFCVFCEMVEPLTELREELEKGALAVGVRVVDLWFRKYQVLPGRSHPLVMMNGASGYLLFGTKVESTPGSSQ